MKETKEWAMGGAWGGPVTSASAGTIMLLKFRRTETGEPCGYVIHRALKDPVPFANLGELILRIDGISRLTQAPPGTAGNGEFRSLKAGTKGAEAAAGRTAWLFRTEERPEEEGWRQSRGEKAVLLHLMAREHWSLQGRIRGAGTGGAYVYFRSALELMHLLSEVTAGQGENGSRETEDHENGDRPGRRENRMERQKRKFKGGPLVRI